MTRLRKSLVAVAAVAVAAVLISILCAPDGTPGRQIPMQVASPGTDKAELRPSDANGAPMGYAPPKMKSGIVNAEPGAGVDARLKLASSTQLVAADNKIIRNADLSMVVKDVRESAAQITRMALASQGQVDDLNLSETAEGCFSATMVLRIPSAGLEDAVTNFKRVAIRTEHEQITARDVTREFYDGEAHLRNLRAEEQQYLLIMKQSGKIPDTLEVAEHLSDVRDRIERQQATMQVMSHDIEMSRVSIQLIKQSETKVAGFEWRPLQSARVATREALESLGGWFNVCAAFMIKLPVVILWVLTVSGVLWAFFIVGRWIWRRVRHLLPAVEPTA